MRPSKCSGNFEIKHQKDVAQLKNSRKWNVALLKFLANGMSHTWDFAQLKCHAHGITLKKVRK